MFHMDSPHARMFHMDSPHSDKNLMFYVNALTGARIELERAQDRVRFIEQDIVELEQKIVEFALAHELEFRAAENSEGRRPKKSQGQKPAPRKEVKGATKVKLKKP